jgi:hypothetical protein
VPEIASELAEALHRCADELAGIGGSLAYLAAASPQRTAGEQRQLAAVIYHTAIQKFGGVKYDGDPIDQKTIDELGTTFRKLLRK